MHEAAIGDYEYDTKQPWHIEYSISIEEEKDGE